MLTTERTTDLDSDTNISERTTVKDVENLLDLLSRCQDVQGDRYSPSASGEDYEDYRRHPLVNRRTVKLIYELL